jgi:hypothetical protein
MIQVRDSAVFVRQPFSLSRLPVGERTKSTRRVTCRKSLTSRFFWGGGNFSTRPNNNESRTTSSFTSCVVSCPGKILPLLFC